MITLATVRESLASSDPYAGIDRLIRDELARGRTTREVHADLFPLVRDVRRTEGLSDDASEALLGALDALTGRCHPDCRYTDPPIASRPASAVLQPSTVQSPSSEKV